MRIKRDNVHKISFPPLSRESLEPSILPLSHTFKSSLSMRIPPFLYYISTTLASESCSLTESFNSTTPVPGRPSHSCCQFTFSPLVFSVVPHALIMGSVLTLPHLHSHIAQQGRWQGGRGGACQVSMEAAPWMQGECRDL